MFYSLNYLIMDEVIKVSNRVRQCLHLLDAKLLSGLCLSFVFSAENGLPVVRINDYNLSDYE